MNKEEIRSQMKELAKQYVDCVNAEKAGKEKAYIPASGKNIGVTEVQNMIDASLDMWLTAGRFNDEFEKSFAEKLGVKYALSCNSGSSANLLALSALTSPKLGERQLKKGDEVIAVAAGFPTTVNPIIQNGCIPVFVDCEIGTYNVDVSKIEEAISPKTKVIFLAHTLGNMYDMDKVMALAEKYKLWVIEDSCDALGAQWNGKYAGTIGHIGTYSCYPAHHITMGEGGAVVTDNPILYRILLSFRDWGRDCFCKPGVDNTCHQRFKMKLGNLPMGYDHKYTYSHIGYNLKVTDWQAAIGVAQLKRLDEFLAQRKNNAAVLLAGLKDLEQYLILPKVSEQCTPSWFGFLISVKEDAPFTKQELVEYLENHGIGTRQLFAGNLLRQPMMTTADVNIRIGAGPVKNTQTLTEDDYKNLPGTDFIMNNTFWVGCAQNITEEDTAKTVQIIHQFVKEKGGI
ncbi:MAG: lipopolysaccharide biosynthesis protein RfbH [Alphaproteobacteria bacterium]|nr:lipopolysaccharide biosynthesis protein RfbH [Alphaproteobacteria bacterium]